MLYLKLMKEAPGSKDLDSLGPYGQAPTLLGLRALDLLHDLRDVPPSWLEADRWRWVNSDRFALSSWYELEAQTFAALAEPDLGPSKVGHIFCLLSDVHVTLPFDEAEGNWLLGTYREMIDRSANIGFIQNHKSEEIVSAGLRRVIDGRDLLRRWWAWRRDTDEFRGQGALDLSREALHKLIETVAPDLKLS